MPRRQHATRIAILLHQQSAVGLSLLLKDIFDRANALARDGRIVADLVSVPGGVIDSGAIQIETSRWRRTRDMTLVPPFNLGFNFDLDPFEDEIRLLRGIHRSQGRVGSACLGALLLASAGALDRREATTHWRAAAFVRDRFPSVKWSLEKMLCDDGRTVTAGGYMATVDLGLHLVERIYSRKTASELGQYILAGSVRQKQSVYAQALVRPQEPGSPFHDLERWVTNNLHRPVTIARMAADTGMSLRSFHRHFTAQLGMSPNKYLQLKRIETAKELLRNGRLGMEEILDRIGLMDITSFRKVFTREIGMSPAEFRRRVKQ